MVIIMEHFQFNIEKQCLAKFISEDEQKTKENLAKLINLMPLVWILFAIHSIDIIMGLVMNCFGSE